jgi:uncharacterized membrane protein
MASAPTPAASSGSGIGNNVAGLLCYLFGWLGGLIFLLIEPYKNDRFVRFCAFQSIFFNVAMVVIWIGLMILSVVLGMITKGIATLLMGPLMLLIWLGFLIVAIYLMIKAYGHQEVKLPIIGDLASKQAGG